MHKSGYGVPMNLTKSNLYFLVGRERPSPPLAPRPSPLALLTGGVQVAGFFGMNLRSNVEDDTTWFTGVIWITCTVLLTLGVVLLCFLRHFLA